jgi:hypothetical protein
MTNLRRSQTHGVPLDLLRNRERIIVCRGYRGQINRIYPDKAWGRCQNGVSQRAAHSSPHPAGQHFLLRGTNERTFRTSAAEMTAMGFKMQYDNVFPECDGSTHHQTLWMKEE